MASPILLVEQRRRSSNISRWVFEGAESRDSENERNTLANQDAETSLNHARESLVCLAPAPVTITERRVSEIAQSTSQEHLAAALMKHLEQPEQNATDNHSTGLDRKAQSRIPIRPKSASRPNVSKGLGGDPRVMWERKFAEATAKEKQAQAQISELQRKVMGLEERIRAIKNVKRKEERKSVDSHKVASPTHPRQAASHGALSELDAQVLAAVNRVIKGKDINEELKGKIADAVATAVAQTLLHSAVPAVKPPTRKPPTVPTSSDLCLT